MEVDPMEVIQQPDEPTGQTARDRAISRLNTLVAITVAVLATFMGICKVKDDNIVQTMQQAQANKLDHWAFYQARNIREEIAKATLIQLRLSSAGRPESEKTAYAEAIAKYETLEHEQRK